MKNFLKIFPLLFLTLLSCNEGEEVVVQKDDAVRLYIEAKIWGDEEKETLTCLLQVRKIGPNGKAILLPAPASVALDGEVLEADSAGLSGVFYEKNLGAEGFSGIHSLRFTSPEGTIYEQEFEFNRFRLADEVMGEMPGSPFTIKLVNLPDGNIRANLSLVDTSFATNDVNEKVMVRSGNLEITPQMLSRLNPGPVMMEILLEDEVPLRMGIHHGRITTSYSLNREFILNP